jgi:hypothetical protein
MTKLKETWTHSVAELGSSAPGNLNMAVRAYSTSQQSQVTTTEQKEHYNALQELTSYRSALHTPAKVNMPGGLVVGLSTVLMSLLYRFSPYKPFQPPSFQGVLGGIPGHIV